VEEQQIYYNKTIITGALHPATHRKNEETTGFKIMKKVFYFYIFYIQDVFLYSAYCSSRKIFVVV
jgi:hypothetical protein